MLDLPLFEQEHRAFSAALKTWLREALVADDESDATATSCAWVRALAEGGWLRACVPRAYGGLRDELDVRTLCLARERLAYQSALADFAFANSDFAASVFGPPALSAFAFRTLALQPLALRNRQKRPKQGNKSEPREP